MDSVRDERPLDHTTARIVAELAAVLLPRLRETVAAELAEMAESMPRLTNEGAEEALAALNRLKSAADATTDLLDAARRSLESVTAGVSEKLERLPEQLETFAAQLRDGDEKATEAAQLLRTLERAIPAWEGVLKADGRAQTRELSEFSSEISEMLRDTQTSLLSAVGDAVKKEGEGRDARVEEFLLESGAPVERKMARLEKITVAAAFIVVIACAVTVVVGTILFR
jgi:chromosome segregation ATPase